MMSPRQRHPSRPTPAELRALLDRHDGMIEAVARELTERDPTNPVPRPTVSRWVKQAGLNEHADQLRARAGVQGKRPSLYEGKLDYEAEKQLLWDTLIATQWSVRETARQLGKGKRTVGSDIARFGLERPVRPREERRAELLRALEEGGSKVGASRLLGYTDTHTTTIDKLMDELGVDESVAEQARRDGRRRRFLSSLGNPTPEDLRALAGALKPVERETVLALLDGRDEAAAAARHGATTSARVTAVLQHARARLARALGVEAAPITASQRRASK